MFFYRYKVENDPAGWVTVDPHTGEVTTVKSLDRESTHVTNNIYTILLHAVDNGKSGTKIFHIFTSHVFNLFLLKNLGQGSHQ